MLEKNFVLIARYLTPVIFAISGLLLVACVETSACSSFPRDLTANSINISALTDADLESSTILTAHNNIEICYGETNYEISQYERVLRYAKEDGSGGYILVYDFYGIEDLRLAFRTDSQGQVTEAFEFSPF